MEITYTENENAIWEIMDSTMKTVLEFYQGEWIGFLEADQEQGVFRLSHWYSSGSENKTLNLLKELEISEHLLSWGEAMRNSAEIIAPGVLAVPVKSESAGFFVVCKPKSHMTESSKLQFLATVFSTLVNEKNQVQKLKLALSPESMEYGTNTYTAQMNTAGGRI